MQGLHRNTPFTHSYRAIGKAKVLTLRYDDWNYLLKHFPQSKFNIYKDDGDEDEKDLEKERKRVQIRSASFEPTSRPSELPESIMIATSPVSAVLDSPTESATAVMETTLSTPKAMFLSTAPSEESLVTADIDIKPQLRSDLDSVSKLQVQENAFPQSRKIKTAVKPLPPAVAPLSETKDTTNVLDPLKEEEENDQDLVSVDGIDKPNAKLRSVFENKSEVEGHETSLPQSPATSITPLSDAKDMKRFSESLKEEEENYQEVSDGKINNKTKIAESHSSLDSVSDLQEQETLLPQKLSQHASKSLLTPATSVAPLSDVKDTVSFVRTLKEQEKELDISKDKPPLSKSLLPTGLGEPLQAEFIEPVEEEAKDDVSLLSDTVQQSFSERPGKDDTSLLRALREEGIVLNVVKSASMSESSEIFVVDDDQIIKKDFTDPVHISHEHIAESFSDQPFTKISNSLTSAGVDAVNAQILDKNISDKGSSAVKISISDIDTYIYKQRKSDESESHSSTTSNTRISVVQGLDKPEVTTIIEDKDWRQQKQRFESQASNKIEEVKLKQTKSALKNRGSGSNQLASKRKTLATQFTNAAKKLLGKEPVEKDTLMLEQEEQATTALLNKQRSQSEVIFKRKQYETPDVVAKASDISGLGYNIYDPKGQTRKSVLAFKENITTFEVSQDDLVSISSVKSLAPDRAAERASMLAYADDIAMKKRTVDPDVDYEEKDKT